MNNSVTNDEFQAFTAKRLRLKLFKCQLHPKNGRCIPCYADEMCQKCAAKDHAEEKKRGN